MKLAVILGSLVIHSLAVSAASAASCGSGVLADFTVYSAGNISAQRSDYQGLTGAGGSIAATEFQFNASVPGCFAMIAGRDAQIISAAVNGSAEVAGKATLRNVGVHGSVFANGAEITSSSIDENLVTKNAPKVVRAGIGRQARGNGISSTDHQGITWQMRSESTRLAQLQQNTWPEIVGDQLIINLREGTNVVRLDGEIELENAKQILIRGDLSASLIMNISSDEVRLQKQEVVFESGSPSNSVTWNFMNARFVHISETMNSRYGMPGMVLAPYAIVEFNEGLITGALYAGEIITSIQTNGTLRSGQVNRGEISLPLPPVRPPPVYPK